MVQNYISRKMTRLCVFLLFLCSFGSALAAEDITGFWTTINKRTGKPNSVIAVYPHEGKYYGRIIATYNEQGVMDDTMYKPKDRAPGIQGNPYYSGLDIVWVSPWHRDKYKGYVVDPMKGKTYTAKLWKENGNLILRGEVFIFGRNEVWPPFPEKDFNDTFKKPDLTTFVPVIPKTKN
jgi:uncharacterized protein (DUF2147 family)